MEIIPRIGPFAHILTQPFAHRIHPYVVRFLDETFVIAQSMIEEIPLPVQGKFLGDELFPFEDDLPHGFLLREGCQHVEMIRHQNEEVQPPIAMRMPEGRAFPNDAGVLREAKLILVVRQGIDGDEEYGA